MLSDDTNTVGLTSQIPIRLYDEVRNDIICRFKKYKCVKSIYEFGKTKHKGISDLDIAIVLSRNTRQKESIEIELEKIYRKESYRTVLCGGTIMVFSESDFRDVHYLDDIVPNLLSGVGVSLNTPSKSENDVILICQILDWLPERLLSLRSAVANGNSWTSLLGYLYSIRYTFMKVSRFVESGEKDRNEFIQGVESTRSEWFSLTIDKQAAQINELIQAAYKIGFRDLPLVANAMRKEGKWQERPENMRLEATFSLTPTKRYVSSGNKNNLRGLHKKIDGVYKVEIEVPNLWFYLWTLYAQQPGIISKELSRHLYTNQPLLSQGGPLFNFELTKMLNKRMHLCNSMGQFLRINNIRRGLYKFGWFF